MKTAAEVCRDFVEYAKDRGSASEEYTKILNQAAGVVNAAYESGELERLLKPGDQMDTSMTFRGHKIILEMASRQSDSILGTHYRENMLRKLFVRCLEHRHMEFASEVK